MHSCLIISWGCSSVTFSKLPSVMHTAVADTQRYCCNCIKFCIEYASGALLA